nr:hypothetical protein [Paenibacillus oenotherae]
MPDGKAKLALMEEAIRIADQYLTEEDAYQSRMDYSSAALECGCPERLLVSFAWCLSKFERQPDQYSSHSIMWHYKWVLNQIWRMPQMTAEMIGQVFDDFKEKCLHYGYTLRPYYQQQVSYMLSQGRTEEAALYYKEWRSAARDGLSDCKACEQNLFGVYYFRLNQNKRGLQMLKPIMEGRMSCGSIPENTYGNLLGPLLKMKEYEQAKETAAKAYQVTNGPQYLKEYGTLMEYYTVTDMPKAVKLYERTIHLGLAFKMPWDRFHYLLSVRLFLQEWSKARRRKKLAASEQVTLEWLEQETRSLAAAFDARNGSDYCTLHIEEKEEQIRKLIAVYRKS